MKLNIHEVNTGAVAYDAQRGSGRLVITPPARGYTNAQLDNYTGLRRSRFPSRAPLRMSLRARASHAEPAGTLGFGFWNDPFTLSGGILALPNAVWFFYASPPADMALAAGVPGRGWKAATLYAGRWPAALALPAAAAAVALTRVPGLGSPIMAAARRYVRAHERLLTTVALTDWHEYALEWRHDRATFWVDGRRVHESPAPPYGPLGFVLWIDNQYAIASRTGRFAFGLCPFGEPQWLEIEALRLE